MATNAVNWVYMLVEAHLIKEHVNAILLFPEFMNVAAYLGVHDPLPLKQTLTNESIYDINNINCPLLDNYITFTLELYFSSLPEHSNSPQALITTKQASFNGNLLKARSLIRNQSCQQRQVLIRSRCLMALPKETFISIGLVHRMEPGWHQFNSCLLSEKVINILNVWKLGNLTC